MEATRRRVLRSEPLVDLKVQLSIVENNRVGGPGKNATRLNLMGLIRGFQRAITQLPLS